MALDIIHLKLLVCERLATSWVAVKYTRLNQYRMQGFPRNKKMNLLFLNLSFSTYGNFHFSIHYLIPCYFTFVNIYWRILLFHYRLFHQKDSVPVQLVNLFPLKLLLLFKFQNLLQAYRQLQVYQLLLRNLGPHCQVRIPLRKKRQQLTRLPKSRLSRQLHRLKPSNRLQHHLWNQHP